MLKKQIFVAYVAKDERHCLDLERHLSVLIKQKQISFQHQKLVLPGQEMRLVEKMLKEAHVIILLVSADFLHSDFCYHEQMEAAMVRHRKGEARVIPLLLRACDWEGAPIGELAPLPTDRVPVTLCGDQDSAWAGIVKGIRDSIKDLEQPCESELSSSEPTQPGGAGGVRPMPRATRLNGEELKPSSPTSNSDEPPNLEEVRASYRRLNAYHRHLKKVIRQAFHYSAGRMGKIRGVGWGSHLFDLPVRFDRNPLDKWVYDYMPLAHAHIWWATAKAPEAGSVFISAWHCGDHGVEEALKETPETEPSVFDLEAAKTSSTTLAFYIIAIGRLDGATRLGDWESVNTIVEASEGFKESLWSDGVIHETSSVGLIRYGGFENDMGALRSREDVDRLIVTPLLRLLDAARRP